jgi:hypothetical protein
MRGVAAIRPAAESPCFGAASSGSRDCAGNGPRFLGPVVRQNAALDLQRIKGLRPIERCAWVASASVLIHFSLKFFVQAQVGKDSIMQQSRGHSSPYLPSPNEIRDECRKIRIDWSTGELESRKVGAQYAWRVLVLPHPEFDRRQHLRAM